MRPLPLRTKLTVFYVSILALLIVAIAVAYYETLAHQIDASITEELVERSAGLRGYLKFSGEQAIVTYDENDPEEVFFIETATRLFQVQRIQDGEVVAQSPEMRALGLRFTPAEIGALVSGPEMHDIETAHGKIRLVNTLLPSEGEQTYLMLVGASMEPLSNALSGFLDALAVVLPISLVAAAYLGWLMAGRALSPLKAAAHAADEISAAQLNQRLPIRGAGDELDHLSAAFNRTLARLEGAVGEMKQFTASIAHELRTPLTVLRGEAEIALMQGLSEEDHRLVLSSQLEEFDKLIRMINQTLILARAESGEIRLDRSTLNLSLFVDGFVRDMQPIARAKEVTLECDLQQDIQLSGDAGWLERMLLNLMDNAIKFTPRNGKVTVELRCDPTFAIVRVIDNGPGIAAKDLPHIFDRFFRADPSRSRDVEGAGLGLTLVHWIVKQHAGSIEAEGNPGGGAVFTVRLPLGIHLPGPHDRQIKQT